MFTRAVAHIRFQHFCSHKAAVCLPQNTEVGTSSLRHLILLATEWHKPLAKRLLSNFFKMCSAVIISKPWLFHLVILAWVSWSCRILAHAGLLKRHPVARVRRWRCRALWPGAVVLHGLAGVRTCCSHSRAILLTWESLWEETVT